LTGAVLFGLTYQQVFPQISKLASYGNVELTGLWNLDPYLTIIAFALVTLLLFYLIDRVGLQRKNPDAAKDE